MTASEHGSLRILHAPRNIAGQGSDIVAALWRLGHHAELWEDAPDVFGRESDRVLTLDRTDGRPTWNALREVVEQFDRREQLGLPCEETTSMARRVTRRVVPIGIRRRLARRF